jgi:hypothetical protein
MHPGGMAHSQNPEHAELVNAGLLDCYQQVARRYEAEGRVEEALGVHEAVVRQMPQAVEPRVKLAEAYERHGRTAKAREQVEALRKMERGLEGIPEGLLRLLSPSQPGTEQ